MFCTGHRYCSTVTVLHGPSTDDDSATLVHTFFSGSTGPFADVAGVSPSSSAHVASSLPPRNDAPASCFCCVQVMTMGLREGGEEEGLEDLEEEEEEGG